MSDFKKKPKPRGVLLLAGLIALASAFQIVTVLVMVLSGVVFEWILA
jgi:hypothetical protein